MVGKGQLEIPILFILGSPRSGNTILSRVLGEHPNIAPWFEPVYIWDYHFRDRPDDQRDRADVTEKVKTRIRRAYQSYLKKTKVDWMVEKTPRNCLKIPFVREVFPEARFIFLLRDGRDVILSITKQWEKRHGILTRPERGARWLKKLSVVRGWLGKKSLWRHRLQAIQFEIGPPRLWVKGQFLHRTRWEGRVGWGPRFRGWRELIDRVTPLEFNAHQWVHCAQGIIESLPEISPGRQMVLRYEDFTRDPETILRGIFSFLNLDFPRGFMEKIPHIRSDNSNKWRRDFSRQDLSTMGPIIGKTLIDLGYEKDETWYAARS